MLEKLPIDLYWNVLKFLRHPIAEIFMEQKAYNHYLSSKDDIYINIGGEEFQINDMIPFYDVWRVYKRLHTRIIYRIVKVKLE